MLAEDIVENNVEGCNNNSTVVMGIYLYHSHLKLKERRVFYLNCYSQCNTHIMMLTWNSLIWVKILIPVHNRFHGITPWYLKDLIKIKKGTRDQYHPVINLTNKGKTCHSWRATFQCGCPQIVEFTPWTLPRNGIHFNHCLTTTKQFLINRQLVDKKRGNYDELIVFEQLKKLKIIHQQHSSRQKSPLSEYPETPSLIQ